MMNVLLLKPRSGTQSYFAPIGLGYLAASIERAGHKVRLVDLPAEGLSLNSLRDIIKSSNPDLIGITCMITEYHDAIALSKLVKNTRPETPVIVGGPLPTSSPEIFLRHSSIDALVSCEGEVTIIEILKRLKEGQDFKGVLGLIYKEGKKLVHAPPRPMIGDLDGLPFPARHLLRMENYISSFENWFGLYGLRATNMISSRGCVYGCIYCDRKATGAHWRGRSATNIVDEIQLLMERYRINGVVFNDDMFDINKKRVYSICDEIDSRGLDLIWSYSGSRINHADQDLYTRVRQSGCVSVGFGIESGNQNIINLMQRRIILNQVPSAISTAKKAGLRTMGYFMLGMLDENERTIRETIRFAKSLELDNAGFSRVVPIPGTTLYEMAIARGLIAESDFIKKDIFGGDITLTPMSAKQIDNLARQAVWEFFWTRPGRRVPKPIGSLLASLSPIMSRIMGSKSNIFLQLNRIRESLHIPLP